VAGCSCSFSTVLRSPLQVVPSVLAWRLLQLRRQKPARTALKSLTLATPGGERSRRRCTPTRLAWCSPSPSERRGLGRIGRPRGWPAREKEEFENGPGPERSAQELGRSQVRSGWDSWSTGFPGSTGFMGAHALRVRIRWQRSMFEALRRPTSRLIWLPRMTAWTFSIPRRFASNVSVRLGHVKERLVSEA